jgi:hypothetical protein
MHQEASSDALAVATCAAVRDRLNQWLLAKGAERESISEEEFFVNLRDGRQGICQQERLQVENGELTQFQLLEPTENGEFRTTIGCVRSAQRIDVFCWLEAGQLSTLIAPISYEARCPKVLRDIGIQIQNWIIGSTAYCSSPQRCAGANGGANLASIIRDPNRTLPIIVVSEDQGFQLHPDTDRRLAHELACLANIYSLDDSASWEVTRRLGQDWSCFSGAIRLYWPNAMAGSNPFLHPLWTASRLLFTYPSTETALAELANQLRRDVMAVASFSVREPQAISSVRSQSRRAVQERRMREATSIADYRQLAEEYARSNDILQSQLAQVTEERDRALTDLANERLLRTYSSTQSQIEPDRVTPPATVVEAFERAKASLSDSLTFGDDCERGVIGLNESAGPPDKILSWLEKLAEVSRRKKAGTLGMSTLKWLRDQGLRVSADSETNANNPTERAKRTWHDGKSHRYFDSHLKPSDGTSPDRCVRIYFEWIEEEKQYAVGWIGRHP